MTYNQPYKLAKTIILYAMYKVVFWVTLLWMNVSFGQFYVSDSTVLQIEGTAFISEEINVEDKTIVYIVEGTETVNFPVEGQFVIADERSSQQLKAEKVLTSQSNAAPTVEKIQIIKPKVKVESFVRLEKSADRSIFNASLDYAVGVLQVNSQSKFKTFSTAIRYNYGLIAFIETSKVFDKKTFNKENPQLTSLFSRPPPLF